MARFDDLPAELQIDIFGLLNTWDVKSARAVSRKCRDNATPALYRSILACARYQAMGAFQKISLHPVYCNYVKEIVFDGSMYEKYLTRDAEQYRQTQQRSGALRISSFWSIYNSFRRYQALFNEQEDLNVSGVLVETLARALDVMPHVDSIVYSPTPHVVPAERKEVRDLLPRGCLQGPSLGNHPFRWLFAAIFKTNYTGIRKLTIERAPENGPNTALSLSLFDLPEQWDLLAALHLFQNLTTFKLSIALEDNHERMLSSATSHSRPVDQLANLKRLITSAENLRHLAITITNWLSYPHLIYSHILPTGITPFQILGLQKKWEKLQTLCLEGLHANESELKGLVQCNKDTLQSLKLRKCTLCAGGYWSHVVDEIVFNSSVSSFSLYHVNEINRPITLHALPHTDDSSPDFGYDGELIVSREGERGFINTSPHKESVYDSQKSFDED